MTGFLKKKRKLLIFEAIPILLLLIIKAITFEIGTFKAFEFPVLLIIIGLPFAFLIRKHLKVTCQFHWYVMGGAISLILVPLLVLVLGFLKVNFVFVFSVSFIHIFAFFSCLLLIIIANDEDIQGLGFLTSESKLDLLGILLIGLMVLKFTLTNFSHTFPGWDTFTFWGLDANYIFEFNRLRDAAFTTTGTFHYTSLFTIMFSIIYDFFGKIVEQYATWLNIFILGIGALQVYFFIGHKSVFAKLLGLLSIVVIMEAASSAAMLFYFYADVYCAFLLLQYTLYLTGNPLDSENNYGVRVFLIMLPLVALGFVKSGLFTFTYFFIIIFIFHDIKYLRKYLREILGSRSFWFSIVAIIALVFLRKIYFTPFQQATANVVLSSPKFLSSSIATTIKYIGSIVSFFAKRSPFISLFWCLQLLVMIIATTTKRMSRDGYFIVAVTSLSFLFFVGGYTINLVSLTSGSLARYTSIGMFTIPLTVEFLDCNTNKKIKNLLEYALMSVGVGLLILGSVIGIANQFPFTLSSGTYSDYQLKKYYEMAEKILIETGETAKILIVDDSSNSTILTNMNLPAIFLRYYLMNNSVGGQYNWLKPNNLGEFAENNSAEYIFLLSYDNLFANCGTNLIKGEDYLINLAEIGDLDSNYCSNLVKASMPVQ